MNELFVQSAENNSNKSLPHYDINMKRVQFSETEW